MPNRDIRLPEYTCIANGLNLEPFCHEYQIAEVSFFHLDRGIYPHLNIVYAIAAVVCKKLCSLVLLTFSLLQINEVRHDIRNKGIKEVMNAVLDAWSPAIHAGKGASEYRCVNLSI